MNKEKGRGGIIASMASVAGLDGFYSMPVLIFNFIYPDFIFCSHACLLQAYSATKHAVIGLNRCLQDEFYFNKYGIKFITICPGFTDTAILDDLENRLSQGTLEATLKVKAILPFQT